MIQRLGIIMNGVTGRMGRNQHLTAALAAIRDQGGLALRDGGTVVPEVLLVGRDGERLRRVAEATGISRWTTSLDEALSDPGFSVYFDTVTPTARVANVEKALDSGKHVYTEKPIALSLAEAEGLLAKARQRCLKTGVVSDKLWAPGILKLLERARAGFFGRILMVRIEGAHWVFTGESEPLQRPSWNYKRAAGGGIIFDMLPHYAYLFEAIAGAPLDAVCQADTLVKRRWDEEGHPYDVDVEDSCMAISRLPGGVMAHAVCSWAVRVRRDDVLIVQVDGTEGTAVAGLTHCWTQSKAETPRAQWNRDISEPLDYYRDWDRVADTGPYPNPYRAQWEVFLRHVAEDAPFPWDFRAGVRTLQYADACMTSWRERRWVDIDSAAPVQTPFA